MRKQLESEIKVGIFVSVGVALIMVAVLMLGGTGKFFSRQLHFYSYFKTVDGLIVGAKVILGGVAVGTVDTIEFDNKALSIRVAMVVSKEAGEWIRKDSTAEIATQGVLGDKYLTINMGSDTAPKMPDASELPIRQGKDISQFISRGDQLLTSLDRIALHVEKLFASLETNGRGDTLFEGAANTAKNMAEASGKLNRELDQSQLRSALSNLNQILEKVNRGRGTLGALLNDPSLYDEMRALMGGANRNRIIRNLVRQSISNGTKAPDNPEAEEKELPALRRQTP